jgi:hypothetical protein
VGRRQYILLPQRKRIYYVFVEVGMKLDLSELHYQTALDIIKWCWYNNIDVEKCREFAIALDTIGDKSHIDWSLEIPDQYVSWLLLKFT